MGIYHARDMAILRASIARFPIVLASATPSAETIKNVNDGKYSRLLLTSRFGGASMPKINTIDLKTEKPEYYLTDDIKKPGNLSVSLCGEIKKTLNDQS
jgi:primosomal protein N'